MQAGTETVPDWRTAYTAHGGKDPVANEYYGLPEDLFDPDDDARDLAVDAIAHLPAVLLSGLYRGIEDGLARTKAAHVGGTDGWDLKEAYVRLGLVPPANVLYLPHRPDPDRAERLTAYLIAACLHGACRQATGQLRYDARMARRLLSLPRIPARGSNRSAPPPEDSAPECHPWKPHMPTTVPSTLATPSSAAPTQTTPAHTAGE